MNDDPKKVENKTETETEAVVAASSLLKALRVPKSASATEFSRVQHSRDLL